MRDSQKGGILYPWQIKEIVGNMGITFEEVVNTLSVMTRRGLESSRHSLMEYIKKNLK